MREKTLGEFVVAAIKSIHPQASFMTGDTYESLKWYSEDLTKPTEEEWDVALANVQAEWTAQEYARKREGEFPSIKECVHAILDDTLDALQVKRAKIKLKYPKS